MSENEIKSVPFYRVSISDHEIQAVMNVLTSGWLTTGKKTLEFESAVSKYVNSSSAVAVSSCTDGLFLSLKALGVKPGDEVITTPFTFVSTVNVIIHAGAIPKLVDINKNDLCINPELIEKEITDKTKAIIPVHYAGHPCELDQINKIASDNNLAVIEDAAHAIGAEYKNRKIGDTTNLVAFSFYATKNLTTGEGGMVVSNDEELIEKIRNLRLHGMSKDAWKRYYPGDKTASWMYDVIDFGYKANMTDMQAAIGVEQLKRLDTFLKKRAQIAQWYYELLEDIPDIEMIYPKKHVKHAYHLFVILVNNKIKNRDKLVNYLKENNIGTSVHFIPVYRFTAYRKIFNNDQKRFPITNETFEKIVSLPMYPSLEYEEVRYVASKIKEFFKS